MPEPPATPPTFPAPRSAARALPERLPDWLRTAQVTPSRRAVGGLVLVLLLAVTLGGVLLWRSRPSVEAAPPVRRAAPRASAVSSPPPSLVVDVAGAVRRPGLVEVPAGARVADAIAAAGGRTRDAELSSVNLARPVVDGEQLLVLRKGQQPASGPATGVGPPGGVVDLNTATLQELDGLPGVGPVLAQRILDWRTAHGPFGSVDELREVSGIGQAKFADLKSRVRV